MFGVRCEVSVAKFRVTLLVFSLLDRAGSRYLLLRYCNDTKEI